MISTRSEIMASENLVAPAYACFSVGGASMVSVFLQEEPQWCGCSLSSDGVTVFLICRSLNGALSFPESCGCSGNFPMVLFHSRNRVAASEIFQWCYLTLGIMWLLRKFSNGVTINLASQQSLHFPFSCVLPFQLFLPSFFSHLFPFLSSSLSPHQSAIKIFLFQQCFLHFPCMLFFFFSFFTVRLSNFLPFQWCFLLFPCVLFFPFFLHQCGCQIFFLSNGVSFLSHVCSFFLSFFMCSCSLQSVLPLL